ncbi:MAG TPA: HEAT repeat domain-containing protein [Thermoanaerobaculia bacterium]|nr:HEAT repeat domain-containing protein [Thermoanaerobaculia bacterium]
MKTRMILAAAFLACLVSAPAVRADLLTSDDEKEKQQAKVEKEEDLYDEGNDAIDEHDWKRAARAFRRVADMKMSHADAALYWLAFSEGKMGMRSEAVATLQELKSEYPKSKWNDDARRLELETRQSAGQQIEPEHINDVDLKLYALNGLMNSDPERAVPILDHIVRTSKEPKLRDRALFVLSQSNSPQAYEILSRVARNNNDPDLQRRAVRYLGIMGGERNRRLLADLYNSSQDIDIKKSILRSYMVSGDRQHLYTLAKNEPNVELRMEAINQLGLTGARDELSELYGSETTVEVRKKIIQAMFLGGSADKLYDIAKNEPNLELKIAAVRNLGLLGGERTAQFLVAMYTSDSRREIRRAVINALFIQSNAKALVSLARQEKDPELKKLIINQLSLMHSKEAVDYLMEYLKD